MKEEMPIEHKSLYVDTEHDADKNLNAIFSIAKKNGGIVKFLRLGGPNKFRKDIISFLNENKITDGYELLVDKEINEIEFLLVNPFSEAFLSRMDDEKKENREIWRVCDQVLLFTKGLMKVNIDRKAKNLIPIKIGFHRSNLIWNLGIAGNCSVTVRAYYMNATGHADDGYDIHVDKGDTSRLAESLMKYYDSVKKDKQTQFINSDSELSSEGEFGRWPSLYKGNAIYQPYWLNWNDIKTDNTELKKFLKQNFNFSMDDTGNIERLPDCKTIIISTNKNRLTLDAGKEKATLSIDNDINEEIFAKIENSQIKGIYFSDPKYIKKSCYSFESENAEEKWLSLELKETSSYKYFKPVKKHTQVSEQTGFLQRKQLLIHRIEGISAAEFLWNLQSISKNYLNTKKYPDVKIKLEELAETIVFQAFKALKEFRSIRKKNEKLKTMMMPYPWKEKLKYGLEEGGRFILKNKNELERCLDDVERIGTDLENHIENPSRRQPFRDAHLKNRIIEFDRDLLMNNCDGFIEWLSKQDDLFKLLREKTNDIDFETSLWLVNEWDDIIHIVCSNSLGLKTLDLTNDINFTIFERLIPYPNFKSIKNKKLEIEIFWKTFFARSLREYCRRLWYFNVMPNTYMERYKIESRDHFLELAYGSIQRFDGYDDIRKFINYCYDNRDEIWNQSEKREADDQIVITSANLNSKINCKNKGSQYSHDKEKSGLCEQLKKTNEEQYIMKNINVNITGNGNKALINSTDNSITINNDLEKGLEKLLALLERDYMSEDKHEILKTAEQMKQSCNDPSRKNWLKKKLGWIITKTSEVASISSFANTLEQML